MTPNYDSPSSEIERGSLSEDTLVLERRSHDPDQQIRHLELTPKPVSNGKFRSLGLGLITGAADDDPSAIGTYSSAGALFGPSFLWMAPLTFPMMIAVVYLSSKLGQVAGEGLAALIKRHYPKWLLMFVVVGVCVGNLCEAAADIGGVSAAANLVVPIPIVLLAVLTTFAILALQIFGSYSLIRTIFRWLALALLAYVGSAFLSHPEFRSVLRGTLIPTIHWNREFLVTFVAVMGTTLSPYLYVWEADQQVSEDISLGRRRHTDRIGTTRAELRHTFLDTGVGMFFSNAIMYFIILCTASTLFRAGHTNITSAAEAAQALKPLAGNAAGILFAIGIIGVGFLAIPIMTTGIAYVICQAAGWKHGLHLHFAEAKQFYGIIVVTHFIALAVNFIGLNPIKALVWAGVVQGMLSPPLMLLIMLLTTNRKIMGKWVNGAGMNVLGWLTTAVTFAAAVGVVYSFIHG
jgi:NRAMP (natural resistance-associated macrophage protein)-like metal ion transporter